MEYIILHDLMSKLNIYHVYHLILNSERVYDGFAKDIPFKYLKYKVVKVLIYGCDYVITLQGVNNG